MRLLHQIGIVVFLLTSSNLAGQALFADHENFTRQDTLRGSITSERAWWDLNYYHLEIAVNPKTRFIKGKNTIHYTILTSYQTLQIDLLKQSKMVKN